MRMTVTDLDRAITKRVIRAREAAGLQKHDVGKKLGLSAPGYSHYENFRDSFSVAQLFQLSRILNRSVEYFLGLDAGITADEDELLATYRATPTPEVRGLILRVVKAMAHEK